jgi:hypothetical protein
VTIICNVTFVITAEDKLQAFTKFGVLNLPALLEFSFHMVVARHMETMILL